MARIEWIQYPTKVNQSVRIIPVQVQLPAGVTPANLAVVYPPSSPAVTLYTENSVIVSRTISVPLNIFEVYLAVSVIDDHIIFVANSIDPSDPHQLAVELSESVGNSTSAPIYIDVTPIGATTVTTEKTLTSDEFNGTALNRDLWTVERSVALVPTAPTVTVAASLLGLPNAINVARQLQILRSDVIEGRCYVEFRQLVESARVQNSGFAFGVYFVDPGVTAMAALDGGAAGALGFGFNLGPAFAFANDPNTRFHVATASSGTEWGPDIVLNAGVGTVPAGYVSTGAHNYCIDFDGHRANFFLDGILLGTVRVRIPAASAKRFVVILVGATDVAAPAAANFIAVDRIDVASDERLVIQGAPAGGGGGLLPLGDVRVWSNNKGVSASAGITSTPIDANHEALDVRVMGGAAFTVDVGADPQSQPAPHPGAINDPIAVSLMSEPDHALRTRARVLTDEGAFGDDFSGAALATGLAGTCSFTNGLTAVTGVLTAFTTACPKGSYIKANAHADTAWTQVASVESDTALTLTSGYGGATLGGAASSVQSYGQQIIDAGGGGTAAAITVANSLVTLTSGDANPNSVRIWRKIGSGAGRKGTSPLYVAFRGSLSARRANQNAQMEIGLNPMGSARVARVEFDGADANTTVTCTSGGGAAPADWLADDVLLPRAGITSAQHFYEVLVALNRVTWWIDGNLVMRHEYHVPQPYDDWYIAFIISNTGAVGGSTDFAIDQLVIECRDDLVARVEQEDPAKLQASVVPGAMRSATETSVAAVNASTLLLAANSARKMFSVRNDSDKNLYLAYGGAASAASATCLEPTDYYEDVWPAWTGTVYGFGEAGVAGNWRIRELT